MVNETVMIKPSNMKKFIFLSLNKEKEKYSKFDTWEKAYEYHLETENALNEWYPVGYFKYFFKQLITEKGLDGKFKADLNKYLSHETPKKANQFGTKSKVQELMSTQVPDDFELKYFKPSENPVDPRMFDVYLTNSEIDEIFSDDGGAMAATSIVITGGPGVGKSTIVFFLAAKFKELYPTKKIAIVSSEMEEEDLQYEIRKKSWMSSMEFILTSDYPDNLSTALSKIYSTGFDIIILDSFADICEKLKDFQGMSGSQAENYLLSLIKKSKGGKNEAKSFTLNLIIQQVTKSGNFAGSNKLKHNTTGMLELKRESSGDRYMSFSKNRRCGQYVGSKLYYFLAANNTVAFDTERWEREKAGLDDDTPNVESELTTQLLGQFNELTVEQANRMRLIMLHAGITEDVINQIKQEQIFTDASLEGITFPEGTSAADIKEDALTNYWFFEVPGRDIPLFGMSKSDLIKEIIKEYSTDIIEEEETED